MDKTKDAEIQQLIDTLGSKNGMERQKAREKLAEKGTTTIDYLVKLIDHPKHIYRWEALKTMGEIGDPISIPFYIQALQDDDSDIRWIASENLIHLGIRSVKPLLETLIENTDSIFILSSAHHVFYDLKKSNMLPADFPVDKMLQTLKSSELAGSIKPLAYELLDKFDL